MFSGKFIFNAMMNCMLLYCNVKRYAIVHKMRRFLLWKKPSFRAGEKRMKNGRSGAVHRPVIDCRRSFLTAGRNRWRKKTALWGKWGRWRKQKINRLSISSEIICFRLFTQDRATFDQYHLWILWICRCTNNDLKKTETDKCCLS